MRQSPDFRVTAAIKTVVTRIKSQPLLMLFTLFLLAFALRAIFPDTSYFFWDEAVYLMHGKLFAGQEVTYSETFLRPPLLPLLLSPFAGLASYELVSRLLIAFLNSLIIFPAYYFTKLLFNKKSAVVAAMIMAVLPVHIINSRWILTDALGALLAFSSVTAYVLGFQQRQKKFIYLGGVLAGLAVLMKFTNLLLLALLLPLFIANFRKRLTDVAVSIAAAAAVVAPYLISSALSFGSPFYTFGRAFHVVAEQGLASFGFFLYLLKDAFGVPLLAFLALGAASSIFHRWKRVYQPYAPYLLYCLFATLAYSFFIVGRGVSKPLGMEWEAERFMLLFILFAVPFISYGIVRLFGVMKNLRRTAALSVAVAVAIAAIFSLYPQFVRAYAPAIVHEDGLRHVTKDLGLYLRNSSAINEFGCIGNCPPVAYYSGKRMSVYYAMADLKAASHSTAVVFGSNMTFFSKEGQSRNGYSTVKEFCSGSHCAFLLSRR